MEEKLVFKNLKDVPMLSISLQSTLWNRTGSWRYMRPSYTSLPSPCSRACPLGQDISFYLTSLADGKPEEAWLKILESNPFPSVCGRVCNHPCEGDCNRKDYDQPLAINALERFLGDWGMKQKNPIPAQEKKKEKVAVIGSGPAGLSCAYFLARKGYPVVVYEARKEPGGMLRYGIPAYRLPRTIVKREIDRIRSLGVTIETGKRFGMTLNPEDLRPFSAVFLATGSWVQQKAGIPGDSLQGVWHGVPFLEGINSGQKIIPGKRTVVIGGGNTAIDSARVALRLGSKVTVLYRRAKEDMPAIAEEVEDAAREGVEFVFQAAPVEISGKKEKVQGVFCLKTKPGKPDASGRRSPVPIKGSKFPVKADTVILALGERADLSFLPEGMKAEKGLIAVDSQGRTSVRGFFAGGDAATGEGFVSRAIASGKRAAAAIEEYLSGTPAPEQKNGQEIVRLEKMNLDYFSPMERAKISSRDLKARVRNFSEVHGGFPAPLAKKEAERCFSCGNCIRCNVCLMVCPDVAIAFREGERNYEIDYDHCKGCGICATECPRSAMKLEEETWSESSPETKR